MPIPDPLNAASGTALSVSAILLALTAPGSADDWPSFYDCNAQTPAVAGDKLFISTGSAGFTFERDDPRITAGSSPVA